MGVLLALLEFANALIRSHSILAEYVTSNKCCMLISVSIIIIVFLVALCPIALWSRHCSCRPGGEASKVLCGLVLSAPSCEVLVLNKLLAWILQGYFAVLVLQNGATMCHSKDSSRSSLEVLQPEPMVSGARLLKKLKSARQEIK